MSDPSDNQWQPMSSAPRDGTRILVTVRSAEQGSADVDLAHWGKPGGVEDECWIAADSHPGCVIAYEEPELTAWMPLPSPSPALEMTSIALGLPQGSKRSRFEGSGSGI